MEKSSCKSNQSTSPNSDRVNHPGADSPNLSTYQNTDARRRSDGDCLALLNRYQSGNELNLAGNNSKCYFPFSKSPIPQRSEKCRKKILLYDMNGLALSMDDLDFIECDCDMCLLGFDDTEEDGLLKQRERHNPVSLNSPYIYINTCT